MARMVSVCSCRAAAAFIAIGISGVSAQSGPALSALTVPAASLPEECRLTRRRKSLHRQLRQCCRMVRVRFPVIRGSARTLITGNPQGECFKAVRNYIESLKSQ